MGWLMDAKKTAGLEQVSLNVLPERLRKQPSWPANAMAVGSLANSLRDLDKGKRADWWLFGPGKQYLPSLGAVLKLERAELEARIHAGRGSEDGDDRYFHFEVFPRLRAIDLDEEDPYPGVPPELIEGDGPLRRTWWHAPPGAGRTLVGRWLARRHRWTVGGAGTKCFMETEGGAADPSVRAQRLVVASPQPMPRDMAIAGWVTIETPSGWTDELLAWISARVRAGGHFDREQFAGWLGENPGRADTPGRMIELVAAMDHGGLRALRDDADPRAALDAWVGAHANRKDRIVGPSTRAFLKTHGGGVLIDTEVNRRVRGLPVSPESIALCLPPLRPAPDADAVVEALERGGNAVRELVQPQASVVIAAMEELRWVLRREWGFPSQVSQWLAACVVQRASGLPLRDLGRLLDDDDLVIPLLSRISEPATLCMYLNQVEDLDLEDPALALALDGLNKAATLCLARGGALPDPGRLALRRATVAVAGSGALPAIPLRVGRRAVVDEAAWQALGVLVLAPRGSTTAFETAEVWQLVKLVEDRLVVRRDANPVHSALRGLAIATIAELIESDPVADPELVLLAARDLVRGAPLPPGRADSVARLGPCGLMDSLIVRWGGSWEQVAPILWPAWLKRLDAPPWQAPESDAEAAILSRTWESVPAADLGPEHVHPAVDQAASGVHLPLACLQRLVHIADAGGHNEMRNRLPIDVIREISALGSDDVAANWAESAMWSRAEEGQTAAVRALLQGGEGSGRLVRLLATVPDRALHAVLSELERETMGAPRTGLSAILDGWLGEVMAGGIPGRREHRDAAYRIWRRGDRGLKGELETGMEQA